jgi:subtilisin family serine protease
MARKPSIQFELTRLEDRTNPSGDFVPGEVLIAFDERAGTEAAGIAAIQADPSVSSVRSLGHAIYKVKLNVGVSVESGVSTMSAKPGVIISQPNRYVKKFAEPTDPAFQNGTLWGHRNLGQEGGTAGADSRSTRGWEFGTGTGDTIVAVIDDGVNVHHPDLRDNMWVNPGEIPDNFIDDDGNGFVDDVHGFDFSNTSDLFPGGQGDVTAGIIDDHGTHVAGIVGAVGNNGLGVTGATWKTRIMSLPLFSAGEDSGEIAVAVQAVLYASDMGAQISNNSWGYNGPLDPLLQLAIRIAKIQNGHIFVAAAGNDAVDNDLIDNTYYPTNYASTNDNVVSVAAFDRNDQLADFSQYGAGNVTIGAPGVAIYSTIRGQNYGFKDGTSMASPQVAGALAAFLDATPGATYQQAIDALKNSARRIPAAENKVSTNGVLDIDHLMLLSGSTVFATGAGEGGAPHVKLYRGHGNEIASFYAYDQRFTGGVRVATGDVNGDGVADIITAAGPGGGPHVKVFDGRTLAELFRFSASEEGFRGGLNVTAGDVTGDGRADIVIGAERGGGPRVSIFSFAVGATTLTRVSDFYAYDPGFQGGVRVSTGVFTAGGTRADVVTAPGAGGGPHMRRFDAASLVAWRPRVMAEAMVGDPNNRDGMNIDTGDMNGDGIADIVAGAGRNTNLVQVVSGVDMSPMFAIRNPFSGIAPGVIDPNNPSFIGNPTAGPVLSNGLLADGSSPSPQSFQGAQQRASQFAGYSYGVRVATQDLNNDGRPELLLAGGPTDNPTIGIFSGLDYTNDVRFYSAYDPSFYGGVYIG